MVSRGTDESTERRKLRPRGGTDRTGRILEDVFDAFGELGLIAVPALVGVALSVPPRQSCASRAADRGPARATGTPCGPTASGATADRTVAAAAHSRPRPSPADSSG